MNSGLVNPLSGKYPRLQCLLLVIYTRETNVYDYWCTTLNGGSLGTYIDEESSQLGELVCTACCLNNGILNAHYTEAALG